MLVSKVDWNLRIPSVKLEDLRWVSADCIAVLVCTRELGHGYKVEVVLDNTHDQRAIEFDPSYLPPGIVPEVEIAISCFDDSTDADSIVGQALANVLNARTSIVFTRYRDKVEVELKVCLCEAAASIDLEAVQQWLLPA